MQPLSRLGVARCSCVVVCMSRRDAATLHAELVQRVREQVGPVANFRQVAIVARLPKTRSGKVLRKTMRAIADGQEPEASTIEAPTEDVYIPQGPFAQLATKALYRRLNVPLPAALT